MHKRKLSKVALRIALVYVLVAATWILSSDTLLGLFGKKETFLPIEVLKGWGFVITTGVVLYFFLRRHFLAQEATRGALTASEERFELAMRATNDGVWDWCPDSDALYFSPRWKSMLGYREDELEPHLATWERLAHPEDRERVMAVVFGAMEGRADQFEVEQRVRHKDGHYVDVLSRGYLVRNDQGKAVRLVGTNVDISERKRAEQALRESEGRFATVFQSTPVGIGLRNLDDGKILDVNDAFLRMFGLQRKEVIGSTPEQLSFWANPAERTAMLEVIREQGHVEDFESRFRNGPGELGFMSFTGRMIELAGKPCLLGIFSDITKRKRAEQALRESEVRFATVFRTSPIGIGIRKATDGTVLDVNEAFLRMFGLTREEAIGSTPTELGFWASSEDCTRSLEIVLERGRLDDFEAAFRKRSGALGLMSVSAEKVDLTGETYILGMFLDISKRKEAEQALRESEARFATVFQRSPIAIAITRVPDGYFVDGNPALCALTGYAREELIGHSSLELGIWVNSEDRRQFVAAMTPGNTARVLETSICKRTGEIRMIQLVGEPVEVAGEPCILSMALDDTERKQAEKALRESEEHYRAVVEDQTEAIDRYLPDGTITFVNEACQRYFGKPETELVGQNWFRNVVPDDLAAIQAQLRALTSAQPVFNVEHRVYDASGEVRWMQWVNRGLFDAEGRLVEVQAVGRDITDRKRAEEALRASEERYRAVVESQTDLITRYLPDGTLTYVNEVSCKSLGLPEAEFLGRSWFPMVLEEDVPNVAARVGALSPADPVLVLEHRIQNAEGDERWLQWVNRGLFDAEGRMVEAQGVGRDITERKNAEREIERLLVAAQAASKAKDQFIASLSHELRTPLTTVLAAASALEHDYTLPESAREVMVCISRNAKREARLIDELLDASRLSRGKIDLDLSLVDLVEVLREAVRDRVPDFEARGQQLILELPDDTCWLRVDSDRLHQVLGNLLENASRFSPKGSATRVHAEVTPRSAVVEVRDQGIGIDSAALSRLFNVFEQGEGARASRRGGLGLGLAISRSIIELHGGTISARSNGPGEGATFRVELPRELETVPELTNHQKEVPRSSESTKPENAAPEHSLRALLVDDDEDIGWMIQSLLARAGHDVRLVRSVAEGRNAALNEGPFDVFVIDVGLPDGTGHDLLRELHAQGLDAASIALSGYGSPADIERSRAAGFDVHLVKPVKFNELVDVMCRVSRSHSVRSRALAEGCSRGQEAQ